MKLQIRGDVQRLSSPTALKGDSPFLGATVDQWDKALTGNMDKTLAQLKLQVMGNAPKRDVSTATTLDLASFISQQLATAK